MFADLAAVDGPELTLGHDIVVTGEPQPTPMPAENTTAAIDGYEARLEGQPTRWWS